MNGSLVSSEDAPNRGGKDVLFLERTELEQQMQALECQDALLDQQFSRLDQQEAMLAVSGRRDSTEWKALLTSSAQISSLDELVSQFPSLVLRWQIGSLHVTCEEVSQHNYQTFEQAHVRLQTFLADVYNAKRLHSS